MQCPGGVRLRAAETVTVSPVATRVNVKQPGDYRIRYRVAPRAGGVTGVVGSAQTWFASSR
jgi:hypothetical protein